MPRIKKDASQARRESIEVLTTSDVKTKLKASADNLGLPMSTYIHTLLIKHLEAGQLAS